MIPWLYLKGVSTGDFSEALAALVVSGIAIYTSVKGRGKLLDLLGRHVATLLRQPLSAGEHETVWQGCDDQGVPVASGVYLVQAITADKKLVQKIALVR